MPLRIERMIAETFTAITSTLSLSPPAAMTGSGFVGGRMFDGLHVAVLDLLLHGVQVDMRNRLIAIEDACNLLKRRALGLDVDEVPSKRS